MKTVKSLGAPPADAHWSYGAEYMCRISKPDAIKAQGGHNLPNMGYERMVCHYAPTGSQLYLQNVSGHYYLACCSAKIESWPGMFGVEVKGAKAGA